MRCAATLLLALTACALTSPAGAQESRAGRLRMARVECTGPLSGLRMYWPDGSDCVAELALAKGELRTLTLPIASLPGPAELEPQIEVRGDGSARFQGWIVGSTEDLEARWSRLPAGLRLRPRPEPPDGAAAALRLPLAALLLAAAGFLGILATRARPELALGLGAVVAGAALVTAGLHPHGGRVLEVLEGDGSSWVHTRLARGQLAFHVFDPRTLLTTSPREAALRVDFSGGGLVSWVARSPGASLCAFVPFEDESASLRAAGVNALDDFADSWVRPLDGPWTNLGPWPRGAPLPAPRSAAASSRPPPASLVAGLPPGRGVFLGLRERPEHPFSDEAWVRVVGFEP